MRGDAGFTRDELMSWCEAHGVDFIFGLARNSRLEAMVATELAQAKAQYQASGKPTRMFKEFTYQTLGFLVPPTARGGQGRISRRASPTRASS